MRKATVLAEAFVVGFVAIMAFGVLVANPLVSVLGYLLNAGDFQVGWGNFSLFFYQTVGSTSASTANVQLLAVLAAIFGITQVARAMRSHRLV